MASSPPAAPSWLEQNGAPTVDASAQFEALYAAARVGKNMLPQDAGDYVYLFIPGLMAERHPGYFRENIEALQMRGLDARRVPIDSDAGTLENAKTIREAVLEVSREGKKVVLIGQSKGGVDATVTMALNPELKPHVRAVVTIQSPYGGTPIADLVQSTGPLRAIANTVVEKFFGGDRRSISDLTTENRRAFITANPYPTDIPTVSVASARNVGGNLGEKLHGMTSFLYPALQYMHRHLGLKSDGLVPQQEAKVPGSRVVLMNDMDHAEASFPGVRALTTHYAGPFTEALVSLALRG